MKAPFVGFFTPNNKLVNPRVFFIRVRFVSSKKQTVFYIKVLLYLILFEGKTSKSFFLQYFLL